MAKSTKKKFLSFLNLLILFILFCCLSGCGNSETTDTGTGTTTGTGRQIALSGSPTSLAAGQNSILTATVTNSSGSPISGQTVAFAFVTNISGGTVVALNGGTTDAGGHALAVYTAGATSPTTDAQDTVQASVTGATGIVVISRMSTSSAAKGYRIYISASPSSLDAGGTSIITATVYDGTGSLASGQAVTFGFVTNNSGATLTTLGLGITDAGGQAVATYTAGANLLTKSVQDTIQASVTGAIGTVLISRFSGTSPGIANISNIFANPSTVTGGQMSVIEAQVCNPSIETINENITFTLLVNSSGGRLINSSGASVSTITIPIQIPSGSCNILAVTYKSGTNISSTELQDVVQATLDNGSTTSVIITRSSSSAVTPVGYQITITPKPASLVAGALSVIVAQVNNGDGTAAPGQTVTFGFVTNNSGAILANLNGVTTAPVTGITDASGTATAIYTAGNNSPNLSIQDVVSATVTGSARAVIITRTGSVGGTGFRMTVVPSPTHVYSGQESIVIATVKNADATPAVGQTVTFSFAGGAATGTSGATISTINSGLTNASGEAWAVYIAGSLTDSKDVIDIVQAGVTGTVALTTITRSQADYSSGGYSIRSFGGIPATGPGTGQRFSDTGATNCELKATVSTTLLSGVAGIPVTFTIFRGPGTLPAVTTIVTDTNGEAWIFFDLPVPGAGNETIVRATVPLLAPQTNGGDAVSVIYW